MLAERWKKRECVFLNQPLAGNLVCGASVPGRRGTVLVSGWRRQRTVCERFRTVPILCHFRTRTVTKWVPSREEAALWPLDSNVQPTGIPGVTKLMAVIRKRSLLGRIAAGLILLLPIVVCGSATAQPAVESAPKAPPSE